MECRDTERLIDAYLDRELSEEAARRLESHLAGCNRCQGKHGAVVALLTSPQPISVPGGLRERVTAAVTQRAARTGRVRARSQGTSGWSRFISGPRAAAVAASLILIFVGWSILRFPGKSPGPEPGHLAGPPPADMTAPPSPWMLSSWAQAMTLPGPGNPAVFLVQGAAMESLTRPSPEESPVIRVRPVIRDPSPPDAGPAVPEIAFILAGLSNLGA